jgi:hypothetical protein
MSGRRASRSHRSFIGTMIATSLISRAMRSTELRIRGVEMDEQATALLAEDEDQVIRLITPWTRPETKEALDQMDREVRYLHNLGAEERLYFFEIERRDVSELEDTLHAMGERIGKHSVLRARSPVIANAMAAMLIFLEKTTERIPHAYFKWTEGNPIGNLFRFMLLGEGDVAPIAHEVLRRAIPDVEHRPVIHVS